MSKSRCFVDIMASNAGVTGTCHVLPIKLPNKEECKIAIDCGMFQGNVNGKNDDGDIIDKLNRNLIFDPSTLDALLISHNHIDHTGRIPLLCKKGFRGKIYLSEDTKTLLPYALNDSCSVLNNLAEMRNTKALYNESDVSQALSQTESLHFKRKTKINDYTTVTLFQNGHLIGAALILVQIKYPGENQINLLFTGDWNNKNVFLDVQKLPEWVLDLPLTVIIESTYGTSNSSDVHECLADNVARCIRSGGTVVIPAFALGRFQEILYLVKEMQRQKYLSSDISIWGDGKLGISYTKLMLEGRVLVKPSMMDFLPDNFNFVDKPTRNKLLVDTSSKIIVTTSGSGSYGPAIAYIPEYAKRKNAQIHFTSLFTPEGSLAYKLKNTQKGEAVDIGGRKIILQADTFYTGEISAHAKGDELIEFLKKFKNLQYVLVNHGEPDVKEKFSDRILKEIDVKEVGILNRDYVFRIGAYGLEKTINTKYK